MTIKFCVLETRLKLNYYVFSDIHTQTEPKGHPGSVSVYEIFTFSGRISQRLKARVSSALTCERKGINTY